MIIDHLHTIAFNGYWILLCMYSTSGQQMPDHFLIWNDGVCCAIKSSWSVTKGHFVHHHTRPQYTIVTYQSQVRKQKIRISLFLYYISIFTLSHIYNAQMTYAALCFSTKYLLPLLSLLIDPKYAVVPSCLFLSLIRVCDDNLQPLNDVVVHSVSCTCRWCVQ